MSYESVQSALKAAPRRWTVTGAAGFIGSNLVESLLRLNQSVTGLDNFATGRKSNLAEVERSVGPALWKNFTWIEGDILKPDDCQRAVKGSDFVLHQAALGSVPRSMANPVETHASNVTGFLNMLCAARDHRAQRFVFASSSSVYGDAKSMPQVEEAVGNCLSPYALSKKANELYADIFARCYGLTFVGLRYFNVFGPRQDPDGAYAAVIPRWIAALMRGEPTHINGDGSTSRDFCYVANVVQANILAATALKPEAVNTVYNVSVGDETTLTGLWEMLRTRLLPAHPALGGAKPAHRPFQPGDVRHSRADIGKARRLLDYQPTHKIEQGLDEALAWYTSALAPHGQSSAKKGVTT